MARQYDVQGTKSYLMWSIILLAVCLWAFRDGWFPSPSKVELHGPRGAPHAGDHFYPFNQTLAILSGLGAAICAIVHKFVK